MSMNGMGTTMKQGKIFYFAIDSNLPFGGEKHTYEHVDILNEAGFEAYALHTRPNYRHTWFENATPTIGAHQFWEIYDKDKDYIVLPEFMGSRIPTFPGRKVIFNKNLYYGFQIFSQVGDEAFDAYTDESVVAVFAVSDHNVAHLRCSFPKVKVFRMFFHIDSDLFAYAPLSDKQRVIACVAKEKDQLNILRQMAISRSRAGLNVISDYRWLLLEGFNERQMAQTLRSSLVTISLCAKEGLGRTLLEAMASGCLPLGLGVGALKESLPQTCQFEPEDFITMIERLEQITNGFPGNLGKWEAVSQAGRKIAEAYTRRRQKEHLLDAWAQILAL
jgi:glycosyltransferase involved in cell wall biosynthesis